MTFQAGMHRRLALAAVFAAGSALSAVPAEAAGGLLELLFGRPAYTPAPAYAPEPFDMTVRGHKRKPMKARVRRAPKDGEEKTNAHLQQPLDPANDHEWFLKDPTLRRGDIIVLSNRVVVFTGARGQARMGDFTNLFASSMVSKGDREKIRKLTEAPREALVRYQMVPAAAMVTVAEPTGPKPVAEVEALKP